MRFYPLDWIFDGVLFILEWMRIQEEREEAVFYKVPFTATHAKLRKRGELLTADVKITYIPPIFPDYPRGRKRE
jgi:hypothetical protein